MQQSKFTLDDLERACDDLATIPYFPVEVRASVMDELRRMCPHREALQWTVAQARRNLNKWPGLAELRGILCSKYDPADGIDHWCTLPGFTAADAEAKHLELHEQLKADSFLADEPREMLRQIARGGNKQIGGAK